MGSVYEHFASHMFDRFPKDLPEPGAKRDKFVRELQEDLGVYDDEVLKAAYVWFRNNRSFKTFPSTKECREACDEADAKIRTQEIMERAKKDPAQSQSEYEPFEHEETLEQRQARAEKVRLMCAQIASTKKLPTKRAG